MWQGLGTDDDTLVRVCVTRCEVDMEDIKTRFQQEYKKSLRSFIEVSLLCIAQYSRTPKLSSTHVLYSIVHEIM